MSTNFLGLNLTADDTDRYRIGFHVRKETLIHTLIYGLCGGIMIVVLIVRPRGFFGREGVLE